MTTNGRRPPHGNPREPGEKSGGGEGCYKSQYKRFPFPTYSWRRVGDDFVLVDYNDYAHEFTKGSIADFLGVRASEMLSERARLVELMNRCFEEGATVREELPHRYLSIEESEPDEGRCLLASCVFVPPDLVMVHTEDVTEYKEAEKLVRFQANLLDKVGQSVIATDAEGRIIYWNRAAQGIYGWSSREAMGRTLTEMVVSEDLRERAEEMRTMLVAGSGWRGEFTVLRKDGTSIPVLGTATPVFDERGRLVGTVGVSMDVTERKEAEEALKKSEERFRSLVQNSSDIITVISADGTIFYQTPSMKRTLAHDPKDRIGQNIFESPLIHPDDAAKQKDLISQTIRNPDLEPVFEARLRHRDGSWRWVEGTISNLLNDPNVGGIVLNARDITEHKRAEELISRQAELLEQTHDAVFMWKPGGEIIYWNHGAERLYGWSKEEALGRISHELLKTLHPFTPEQLDLRLRSEGYWEGDLVHHARDDRRVVVQSRHVLTRYDSGPGFVLETNQDITERKRAEERLHHQAFHDLLTDLPNRQLFVDRLKQALRRTRRRSKRKKVAVLFMDLGNFKFVNDSLGHEVGDGLLVAVAERLRGCLRPEDTLARFGGDEFTILVEEVEGPEDAVRVANRIGESLREQFVVGGSELFVGASVGIVLGSARTTSPEDLLRDADTAMYRAKEESSGYRLFDPEMYERVLDRLGLENDIRRAIRDEEFVVHYQPIVSLIDREVRRVEALVRWEHPKRGILNPAEFMPLAEETGLVVPVGEGVLKEACRQGQRWREVHPRIKSPIVSVNLSARQLGHSDLVQTVEGALRETGFEASLLSLDVTETVYIKVLEGNTAALDGLKRLGVCISIDDFGVGYSSLAYLKRLPADMLKIDKSFVAGIGVDEEDTAIVRMIIQLAHTLGMEVVAEGVESADQAEQLTEMGCDHAQGFYFSEALPPEVASEFLLR